MNEDATRDLISDTISDKNIAAAGIGSAGGDPVRKARELSVPVPLSESMYLALKKIVAGQF